MQEIKDYEALQNFCKALGADLRLAIVRLLATQGEMNLNELAGQLHVTNGALTTHIRILNEAGIVGIDNVSGRRGMQKICSLAEQSFLLLLEPGVDQVLTYDLEIPIGSYVRHAVGPTCGLATPDKVIGEMDDPRYFDDPQRNQAGIIWFGRGYVEYRIPNYLKANQELTEIQISHELSSEAPGVNAEWPSDLYFSLNGHELGFWTSPGDFGDHRGYHAPEWWRGGINQYGLLKMLSINAGGSWIDGNRIGDCTLDALAIRQGQALNYRLSVPETAEHVGGMTIFGKGFGNYGQGIKARLIYRNRRSGTGNDE